MNIFDWIQKAVFALELGPITRQTGEILYLDNSIRKRIVSRQFENRTDAQADDQEFGSGKLAGLRIRIFTSSNFYFAPAMLLEIPNRKSRLQGNSFS